MSKKVKKPDRINETVFKSYEDVIGMKVRAGKDITNLTKRLNTLLSDYKTK